MTNRQKKLGVTEYGHKRGIIDGEFLSSNEAFRAWIATIKKGQHLGVNIVLNHIIKKNLLYADYDYDVLMRFARTKLEQVKPFLFGLTATMPEHVYYTDTNGLDTLTLR